MSLLIVVDNPEAKEFWVVNTWDGEILERFPSRVEAWDWAWNHEQDYQVEL